ncbi:hypothetical protein KKB18_09500, partial [bacterium]|nr:hypothetical protein [bacterium]
MGRIFHTNDLDKLFIISQINESGSSQCVFVDLVTHEIKAMTPQDPDLFKDVYDIEEWIGHDGKYLVLKMDSVSSYNVQTGEVVKISEEFKTSTSSIMQDKTGSYLYFFGFYGDWGTDIYPDFYILDLNEGKVDHHVLPLDEGWGFTYYFTFFDQDKNIIIATIAQSISWGDYKSVILDPSSLEIKYLTDNPYKNYYDIEFIEGDNRIFICDQKSNSIDMIDIESGELKSSIDLISDTNGWSVMIGAQSPDLMSNPTNTKFCRLLPAGRRELIDADITVGNICQFPDASSAIIEGSSLTDPPVLEHREYNFNTRNFEKIKLPQLWTYFPDPNENQIINKNIGNTIIHFIGHGGSYTSWLPPAEFSFTSSHDVFDLENKSLWIVYKDKSTGNWHFYKLSTETKDLVDSFFILSDKITNIRGSLSADPLGRYLYLIDETSGDNVTRDLVIISLEDKDVVERIALQQNLQPIYPAVERVIPGMIPVPELDKLFIWDGYGSWCFNMSTKEKIYGTVVDNPQLNYALGKTPIEGIFDEKKDVVVAVDFTGDMTKPIDERNSIYGINIETGEVLSRIGFHRDIRTVFFPKNKDEVYFLLQDESMIYHYLLDPVGQTPVSISPSTNYVQLGSGDNAKFTVNIKNPYDFEQRATAYIWMYAP